MSFSIFSISASELFLKCDYAQRYGNKWIKFSADKNKDIGHMERSNGYAQRCDVTFSGSRINWRCRGPLDLQFNVNRETLKFDNGEFEIGQCKVIKTKNKI